MEEGDVLFYLSYNSGVSYFWHNLRLYIPIKSYTFRMRKNRNRKAMRKEERYKGVLNWFKENVPVAETELHYDDPYQLLIAVILSAQCTDKRVNMITPALFEAFPTPEVMAASTPEVVFEYIRSVSYPNNKAKHLVGMAKMLIEEFQRRGFPPILMSYRNFRV